MHDYKTIVVHIDGGPDQESRLAVAARLCDAHGAHLVGSAATGITWFDYALLTGSIGAPVPDPGADFRGLRDAATARLDGFRAQAARLGIASVEARLVEDDARYALLLQSRYADLVVVSQDAAPAAGDGGSSGLLLPPRVRRLPEYVALRGARPVLVVPQGYLDQPLPGKVVVGWDGSIQAIRAIDAALPLLQRATGVTLALVNPDILSELHGEEPGADIALYLARHGVRVEVEVERTRGTVGEALVALARRGGAGLMVTGAYGHSRYREWILGGVTRELLERVPVPLLIAH
ncbi:universal stress protein [uncultured Massilia sp.]|uniref:universal stress protein n=1 Tax=uncultured Massilia sp. TaxID=169973 RepID=UPI0025E1883D|nr:universal stress protein [uncultured Massilia sp.]